MYYVYTLTAPSCLNSHPAAEGNVLSVPRARGGGSTATDAKDSRRLLHLPEPATESESEREPSVSSGSIVSVSPLICSRSPLLSLRFSTDRSSSLLTFVRSISASISCSRVVETIGMGRRSWHE
eukprot:scaffold14485_cov67-Phaeocystis_antarctica.AAC.2